MNKRATQEVLTRKFGDVTGDGVADEVYLVGTRVPDSQFIQDITLMIRNGRTGMVTQVALRENAGYMPTIFLCDFTGDGVEDIKVTIQSGGSGGFNFIYIYSFVNSQLRLLFDAETYIQGERFRAFYADGFVIVVVDELLDLTFRIDVSTDPAAADLYDQAGKLLQPTEANVGPLITAIPIILDEDSGRCDLQALVRVYGQFAADTVGYIQDYLRWDVNNWRTVREDLAIGSSAPVSGQ